MKFIKQTALVLLSLTAFAFTAQRAGAYDRDRNYEYGHDGYWDNHDHHRYHHWDHYRGHEGYWHRRSDGVRVFINI